jgi:hypothetical protein
MSDIAVATGAKTDATRKFYVWMAGTFLAIAVLGFLPTYFAPMAQGRFEGPPIIHIHGMIMFAWVALFFVQTLLVSRGATLAHRSWGMLGIAIVTAMAFSVFTIIGVRIHQLEPLGLANTELAFSWIQVSGVLMFVALFTLAIANIKKSDTHKRLMILATISILDAPIARWFAVFLAPPHVMGVPDAAPPAFIDVPPALISDLLIVAAIVFDWRTRGKPHPAYLWGGAAILLMQFTRVPIAGSASWQDIAAWIGRLGG